MIILFMIVLAMIGCFIKNKKVQLGVLGIIGFLLILHMPIGRDIPTYIEAMEMLPHVPTFGSGRFFFIDGWYSVFNWLFDSPEIFLFIVNGLTTIFVMYTIYKQSLNYGLSLFLVLTSGFFAVYMQSAIRQGLAMAVLLWSTYRYLIHGHYLKFTTAILLMATFHDVALIGLVLIPLHWLRHRLSDKLLYGLLVLCVAGGLTMGIVFEWISPYLGYFGMYLSSYQTSIPGIGLQVVLFALTTIAMVVVKPNDDTSRFMYQINAMAFGIYLVLIGYPAVSRVCDFFQVINIIFIPNLLHHVLKPMIKYLLLACLIGLNFYLYQSDLNNILYGDSTHVSMLEVPYYVYGVNDAPDILKLHNRLN